MDFSAITIHTLLEEFWPFERIYGIADPLEQEQALTGLAAHGKTLGVNNVKSLYSKYVKSLKKITTRNTTHTAWDGQDWELETTWTIDESGIHKFINDFDMYACSHPITISKRIYNIDTGVERIELQYKAGHKWRKVIVDKMVIASTQKIIELANYGIAVTSENNRALISYLQELEALNYHSIPTIEATSRLGWVGDNTFMPYAEQVIYDGDIATARLFESVCEKGDDDEWLSTIKDMRKKSVEAKIALAATALSPMMQSLSILPSFVHFWASKSSTGKTVILMGAASFWGNPELGAYTQSFNATTVALERTAETLNSLPLIMDELQLSRDRYGQATFDVYKLAQGLGKGRGTKTGGIERTPTWHNTIITSGETPIVKDSDGQGAYARALEVKINDVIFTPEQGNKIVRTIRENYGHGGRMMVAGIRACGEKELSERYEKLLIEITKNTNIQEKQAVFAAGLILADQVANEFIWFDTALTLDEILPYLMTRDQTSVEQRAIEYLMDWIAGNSRSFMEGSVERYGFKERTKTYIIRNKFNEVMEAGGFNARSVLSSFADAGWIETSVEGDKTRTDVRKSLEGVQARFVCLLEGDH